MSSPKQALASIKGFEGVRLSFSQAGEALEAEADRLSLPRSIWDSESFDLLAISGGASGGAFGAGVLTGLTLAGRRPTFAIVTGVSTGALIAPFAFLGPAWDDRLREAYTGGHAAESFGLSALSPVLDGGLFRAEALERLVHPFVDDGMVAAVAAEHRLGRRLLVATTDLDRETPCIWDMGAIAVRGGSEATALFREVLIASASLPGLFPPRRFEVEADGETCEEMHVDGGVVAPLFVMPEALMRWRKLGRRMQRGRIYVIINTALEAKPRTTPPNLPSVLLRSFDTMLRVSYRQALNVAVTFSVAHNLPLSVASIPDAQEGEETGSMLSFDTATMKRIFEAAVAVAQEEDFWKTPAARQDLWSDVLDLLKVR